MKTQRIVFSMKVNTASESDWLRRFQLTLCPRIPTPPGYTYPRCICPLGYTYPLVYLTHGYIYPLGIPSS